MRFLFVLTCLVLFNNGYSQSYIPKQKVLEDIHYFNTTLQQVHVNPFLFINKQKYFSQVQSFEKSIGDSIEVREFIRLLYKMTALLKDGHTAPYIVQGVLRDELQKPIFFPYQLVVDNNLLYVPKSTSVLSGIPTGAVITTINNKSVKTLLADFARYPAGSKEHSKEMESRLLSYFLFLHNLSAPFNIVYKDSLGKQHNKVLEKGATFINALSVTMPHLASNYDFHIMDKRLGYFDFRNMSVDIASLDKYIDSCVTVLNKLNIRNLAIDLRNNPGGNSVTGDLLLGYFTKSKYFLSGGKDWKISGLYKEHIRKNGDTTHEYLSKPNGTIWHTNTCVPHPPLFNNDNVYTGKVFFIINPFTFSSANMLADGAKEFKIATLVGEETGENCSDFGEAFTFMLPNSKIRMQATSSFEYGADCNKNKLTPVKPDIQIKSSLKDKINERDKPIEFLLKNAK